MDFNRLKTFIIVAQTGNMTRAAEQLFRTQSAITQQMKLLQEELGLVLFERRKARIFLTAHGKTLYEFAKPRIRELEDLPAKLRNEKEAMEGFVRIEACSITGPLLFPFLVSGFQKNYPNIRFQMKLVEPTRLEEHLLRGDSDFFLSLRGPESPMISHSQLERCTCIPVRGATFEMPSSLGPADPRRMMPWISLEKTTLGWDSWLRFFSEEDSTSHSVPRPAATVSDVATLHQLVSAGLGIGMAFLPLAEKELSSGRLIPLFQQRKPLPISIHLAFRQTRNLNLAHDLFLEHLCQD